MAKHDRRRRGGDGGHIVMLRHPDAAIAPSLGMSREIARIVERAARIGIVGDADEIEDGKGRHECSRMKPGAWRTPLEMPGFIHACPERETSRILQTHMERASISCNPLRTLY